jgi:hypothetical protein
MKTLVAFVALAWSAAALAAGNAEPAAGASGPQAPHKLAVLDFALSGSAHPELARVLSDAAASEAGKVSGYQVVSQSEVVAMLGLERAKQMLGCSDDAGCQVELAGALNADRLLAGSVTVIERTALLAVRLIEVKRTRTLARTNATLLEATETELVDAARRLAHEALTGERLDTTGTLRLAVDRAGAQVSLDGKDLGSTPIAGAQRVLEGPHQITVQKKGYIRWSSTVTVAAGAEVPVTVQLVPLAALGEAARSRLWTWGWVASGVAVAGAGAGVIFGRMAKSAHDDYVAAATRTDAVKFHDQANQRSTMANVSWAVAGVAAASATGLLVYAAISDAKASAELAAVPVEGGGLVAVGGSF